VYTPITSQRAPARQGMLAGALPEELQP
jgi:hypothetical protein